MVSALQDLSNRIATNTLTGAQQGALTTALAAIIPFFPSTDDTAVAVPIQEDIPLSREWISALYSLVATAASGGTTLLPTQQPAWFLNFSTGSDSNDGLTAGTPLKTAAALANLWKGVSGGGRPVLSPNVGTTITITIQANTPTTDPISVLLDVDLAQGISLIFVGGLSSSTAPSTLTTASAFARTAAAGQQTITDVTVPNFGVQVGVSMLFRDTTTNAVAWLYGPDPGPSATGFLTIPYAPQTPGGAYAPAAPTAIAAGNTYTLSAPIVCSLGQGFVTRSFPQLGASASNAQVFFYRLHFIVPFAGQSVFIQSPTASYTFQECQTDCGIEVFSGTVAFVNSFSFHNLGLAAVGGAATLECLFGGGCSGTVQSNVSAINGAFALVDGDFLLFSNVAYTASAGGTVEIGNAGFWTNGSAPTALEVFNALAAINRFFQATSILYGQDGGVGVIVKGSAGPGTVLYRDDSSGTPAANQFQLTHQTFTLGDYTSPFGVTTATAAYVGPTTGTMAHLDAALGAGTGFGGRAVDNSTMSTFRIAA
jgi:hypothetical protein